MLSCAIAVLMLNSATVSKPPITMPSQAPGAGRKRRFCPQASNINSKPPRPNPTQRSVKGGKTPSAILTAGQFRPQATARMGAISKGRMAPPASCVEVRVSKPLPESLSDPCEGEIAPGCCSKQGLGVGMLRRAKNLVRRAVFDHFALGHHRQLVANL